MEVQVQRLGKDMGDYSIYTAAWNGHESSVQLSGCMEAAWKKTHSNATWSRQSTVACGLFMKSFAGLHKGKKRKHTGHNWVERKPATGSLV